MNNIKISVIMSVFDAEKYLVKAIESILNQTYNNIEFVIINDGSSDNSLEIIKYYAFNNGNIIVIDQKNKGLTKSLNIGIKKATGDYIARMDADDISSIDRFKNFKDYIDKNGEIDLYSTPAYVIDENGIVQKTIPNFFRRNGFNKKLLNYHNSMIHGTLIIKTEILKKYMYNEDYAYSQDFELYHRLIRNGYEISYDKNNTSYKLRVHSRSTSKTHKSEQIIQYKKVFKDNNIKFYKHNILYRIYFRLVDIYYTFKILKNNIPLSFKK